MALARIFEALVCTCFYAGICYMLFDGAGKECQSCTVCTTFGFKRRERPRNS